MFLWITRRLEGRLYEWALAAPTLASGLSILWWPGSLQHSAFHRLMGVLSEPVVALVIVVVGILRLFALAINGHSDVVGPLIRCACSVVSAFMWSQFSYALYEFSNDAGFPSPGIYFWISITLAEIFVSYRAVMDVRRFVDQ